METINIPTKKINTGARLGSALLDHVIMSFVAVIFTLPFMISNMAGAFEVSHHTTETPTLFGSSIYVMILALSIYICKDSFNGQSIAKRMIGLQVIDKKTKLAASPLKCLVRNLFIPIWPIEVIMMLINPSSRLGDKVAGTEVVYFDKERVKTKPNISSMIMALIFAYGFLYILLLPLITLSEHLAPKTSVINEAYYNANLSKEVTKQFNDSLQQYMAPDIRIYNRTTTDNNMYISAIFNLKEDYNLDDEGYENMKNYCYQLLTTTVSKPFNGRMQFVYNHGSTVNIRESKIENER